MKYHLFNENQRNFIISETPTNINIETYIKILQRNNINLVINLTETITYNNEYIKNKNIDYIHFPIKDGDVLTDDKIFNLKNILERYNSIAFHCVAGLGRAPLVCAISFLLLNDTHPIDIIEMIRKKEPNSFNTIQINYLYNFKRKKYLNEKCVIC